MILRKGTYKNWKRCWYCGRKTKRQSYVESPKYHIKRAPVCYHCEPHHPKGIVCIVEDKNEKTPNNS